MATITYHSGPWNCGDFGDAGMHGTRGERGMSRGWISPGIRTHV